MEEQNVMSDAQRMKFQADIYYMSANLLMEEKELISKKIVDSEFKIKLTEDEREKMFLSFPAHCLYAFCAELYLKSLILNDGKTYSKIHHFDDLFNVLSANIKTEIESEYSKSYNGNLSELLSRHRNDFQKIRYVGEGVGGAMLLSFVKWLADTLRIVADNNIAKFEKNQTDNSPADTMKCNEDANE